MSVKLREFKRDKAYYRMLNRQRKEKNINERVTIKRWRGCCKSREVTDAEAHYKNLIKNQVKALKNEQIKANKTNGGIGYVTFTSNADVKKVVHRKDYKKLIMDTLSH